MVPSPSPNGWALAAVPTNRGTRFVDLHLLRCNIILYAKRMKLLNESDRDAPQGPVPTIFEAIVRKRCVVATYNRVTMTLAPHVIYTKHGDLFIDAVALEKDGKPPKEEKIGTFKLAGLNDLQLTVRAFPASRLFHANDAKYAEALIAVEAA